MTPSSSTAPPPPLETFWRSFLATQVACLLIAGGLWLVGGAFGPSLLYSLLIGNLCNLFVHLGRHGAARWAMRRGHAGVHPGWPGWGLMAVVIALTVPLAYLIGGAAAAALLGLHQPWPGAHQWRAWAVLLGISLVPTVLGTYHFYNRSRLAQAEALAEQAARQATQVQLKLLESQLEPHMLFNTLANLRALIGVDPPAAQAMLDHMIAWLRSTLSASRRERHALQDEFRHVEDYLALMKVRMGDRLLTRLELPAPLAELPVPPLLLQPLVENAIRHGLEPLRGPARLELRAHQAGEQLCLEVLDNGVGLEAARATAGTGFGTTQVRERLATLHGDAASLELLPRPEGGTLARVRLPLSLPSP
jgi:signal transduction histidine kinase